MKSNYSNKAFVQEGIKVIVDATGNKNKKLVICKIDEFKYTNSNIQIYICLKHGLGLDGYQQCMAHNTTGWGSYTHCVNARCGT